VDPICRLWPDGKSRNLRSGCRSKMGGFWRGAHRERPCKLERDLRQSKLNVCQCPCLAMSPCVCIGCLTRKAKRGNPSSRTAAARWQAQHAQPVCQAQYSAARSPLTDSACKLTCCCMPVILYLMQAGMHAH